MRTRKPFEELTISDDIAQKCTSLYISAICRNGRSKYGIHEEDRRHGTGNQQPRRSRRGC